MKKLKFRLNRRDRIIMQKMLKQGKLSARGRRRISIIMALDHGSDYKTIGHAFGVDQTTIWRTKKTYMEEGLARVFYDKPHPGRPRKYKTKEQAMIALAYNNPPPKGRERWSVRLLTHAVHQWGILRNPNRESIRLILKRILLSTTSPLIR